MPEESSFLEKYVFPNDTQLVVERVLVEETTQETIQWPKKKLFPLHKTLSAAVA